jgi:uncharacterized membrane protein
MRQARRSHRAPVAGLLIGIGMGGFVDGIVLHQIAQWAFPVKTRNFGR